LINLSFLEFWSALFYANDSDTKVIFSPSKNVFFHSIGLNKRSRGEGEENVFPCVSRHSKQQEEMVSLRNELQQRVSEAEHLKGEKTSLESVMSQTKHELDRVNNENRILKKAVTIQQERQTQALSEIDAACRYRTDAEERIRRLEHMNLTLRFQLQARDSGPNHDFMGFEPRHPDVC
jgi:hypothetical protein